MPSIHISEMVFARYVDETGSYEDAKDAIKDRVREGVIEDE